MNAISLTALRISIYNVAESKKNRRELLARNARFDVHLEGPFWNSLGSIFGPSHFLFLTTKYADAFHDLSNS
jgi:hypothetical protein